ncbi:MAG: hypothetical protein Harvfovirus3_2 [Harvfovirus sp.]|uniref:Uncharacterized protein n=1 Tax=Harvfovirus sp. TaxID=2487768 RepID=A0A3G5A050_9VIRU|nr:MAG: hypothetical protein Harvfovirus3_2 [Harvfovirus sp.]
MSTVEISGKSETNSISVETVERIARDIQANKTSVEKELKREPLKEEEDYKRLPAIGATIGFLHASALEFGIVSKIENKSLTLILNSGADFEGDVHVLNLENYHLGYVADRENTMYGSHCLIDSSLSSDYSDHFARKLIAVQKVDNY